MTKRDELKKAIEPYIPKECDLDSILNAVIEEGISNRLDFELRCIWEAIDSLNWSLCRGYVGDKPLSYTSHSHVLYDIVERANKRE